MRRRSAPGIETTDLDLITSGFEPRQDDGANRGRRRPRLAVRKPVLKSQGVGERPREPDEVDRDVSLIRLEHEPVHAGFPCDPERPCDARHPDAVDQDADRRLFAKPGRRREARHAIESAQPDLSVGCA